MSTSEYFSVKKGFAQILILGVLLAVFVLGASIYLKQAQRPLNTPGKITAPNKTTPENSPSTITQSEETKNWKTYTNTAYKYEIKYPVDWQITVKGEANPATFPAPYIESLCNYESGQTCSQLLIETAAAGSGLEPTFIINPTYDKVLSRKTSKLDTEQAQEIVFLAGNQETGEDKLYYVLVANHNNTKYSIRYEESAKNRLYKTPTGWRNKGTVDQIISTFKFTN